MQKFYILFVQYFSLELRLDTVFRWDLISGKQRARNPRFDVLSVPLWLTPRVTAVSAARAQCWLMLSLYLPTPPGPFPQGCSQPGRPQTVLLPQCFLPRGSTWLYPCWNIWGACWLISLACVGPSGWEHCAWVTSVLPPLHFDVVSKLYLECCSSPSSSGHW